MAVLGQDKGSGQKKRSFSPVSLTKFPLFFSLSQPRIINQMIRATYKEIEEEEYDEVPRTNGQKTFQMDYGKFQYCNSSQRTFNENSTRSPTFRNCSCYLEDGRLVKVTQISMGNMTLQIKDDYKMISEIPQKEPDCELPLLKKRNNYSDPKNDQKSDTRNLIKNVVNIYINWLKHKTDEKFTLALKIGKQIIHKNKYFNKLLIQEMSKQKLICETFIQFAEDDGEILIDNSRIHDKTCHFKALKNFSTTFRMNLKKNMGAASNSNSGSTKQ